MNEGRRDPDGFLARIREETRRAARGRLRIFLGAAAGVGTTYAMLQAAKARCSGGVDVVAGHIEAHKRSDTATLVEGFEVLPAGPSCEAARRIQSLISRRR